MKKTRLMICLLLCATLCFTMLAGCKPKTEDKTEQPSSNGSASPSQSAPQTSTTPPPIASSPEAPPEEAKFKEELLIAIGDKVTIIDLFNPAFQSSQICLITNMIYDCLVYRSMEGEYSPELAKDWKTDDYKTFTFYLRDDVYFHNGEKFTADDVAFTIDTAKASPGTPANSQFNDIESYEIVNDYEVKIVLEKVNVDYLFRISFPTAAMLNREAYAADAEKGPWVGTGPFMVTDFLSNDYIEFIRNDDYFKGMMPTKKMTIKYIAEETARMIMFDNDQLDFCGVSANYLPTYKDDPNYNIVSYTMDNCNFVAFNMKDPLLSDINFRTAVALAFDNEECLAITLKGGGAVTQTGVVWGNRTEFKNLDIPQNKPDLEKAKEYLEKTSYNGETIEIVASMAHPISNAQILQSQLSKIGIKTEIYETDGATMGAYTPWGGTDAQIIVSSSVWSNLASSCKSVYYPGQVGNKANYENPAVTELIDKAAATVDAAEREKIYKEIQALVAADIPYLPIFHMSLYVGGQAGTGGFLPFPNNNHDYSMAYRIMN